LKKYPFKVYVEFLFNSLTETSLLLWYGRGLQPMSYIPLSVTEQKTTASCLRNRKKAHNLSKSRNFA